MKGTLFAKPSTQKLGNTGFMVVCANVILRSCMCFLHTE